MPFIFFVLYGIGQLMAGRENANPPAPRRRPKPEGAGPKLGDAPRQEPVPLEDTLRNEVEDFIRRVQGQEPLPKDPPPAREAAEREKPQRQNIPKRPRWADPLPEERTAPRRHQPFSGVEEPLPEVVLLDDDSPTEVRREPRRTPIESRPPGLSGSKLPQSTLTSRNPKSLQQLTGQVALPDQHLQTQFEQRFQHRLGSLEHHEETVVKAVPTAAQEVLKMLRSPEGMKQAIVLNEVLRRPEI